MRKALYTVIILFGTLNPAFAAFNETGLSPRAAGQGGAFTSADDDSAALFYNPAGSAFLRQRELSLMYSRPFSGLERVGLAREYAIYCMPTESAGAVSLGWTSFQANDVYREDALLLSYSRDISSLQTLLFKAPAAKALSAGVTLKYLKHGFVTDARTRDDPVFAGGDTRGAFTADAGLLFRKAVADGSLLNAGVSVKNLVPADTGLLGKDNVPLETRLGLSWYTVAFKAVYSVNAAADVVMRGPVTTVHLGGECWVIPRFGVRLGGNPNEYAFGLSGDFDLNGSGVRLDYSFLWPLHVQETSGSHVLALVFKF
ncbi:MAG: PorV/PorQ family protein [Endomicrobiales bacterium]